MERWRYVGVGAIGHIWHDTTHDRYVISDEHGPEGTPNGVARGIRTNRAVAWRRAQTWRELLDLQKRAA
jgi:hypothetical protein